MYRAQWAAGVVQRKTRRGSEMQLRMLLIPKGFQNANGWGSMGIPWSGSWGSTEDGNRSGSGLGCGHAWAGCRWPTRSIWNCISMVYCTTVK